MEEVEITLPKLGESIVEATIVQWFKQEGEAVQLDEPLLEVSTDKVNSEIPSPFEGTVKKILVAPDEQVKVGDPLVILSTGKPSKVSVPKTAEKEESSSSEDLSNFYSPAVLKLAKNANLSLTELDAIPKTGEGGRLTKKDLEKYLEEKQTQPVSLKTERVKMSSMRKMIAENMVRSFYEAPHASLVSEVDVTGIVKFIAKEKEQFLQKHGVKLSITSFVAKALSKALQTYPLLNSSLEDDTIVMKKYINLGIAVSIENGVLVPVIHNCQDLSIPEISQQIYSLASKARSNSLDPSEISNGTITLTNFGMMGTQIGIPIIRYPEVAIIGLGAISKKVVALSDDSIAIRSIMMVSLTFDHRVLDGMYGCGFLKELKNNLESQELNID
ncbi:MAG: branched-chain alpha-keto acid dehydrogenase subunit E2 [Chlamydiae bacterium CG10_big_fil_rev_8_21_14_0_10_35_9]|nr:MAG: branched-chain alpha-keto acid dehydrogenase subunit E2 [Chlamydiae bacterium CG10_big_fil_rev_8_21_14_0_10_35_9]